MHTAEPEPGSAAERRYWLLVDSECGSDKAAGYWVERLDAMGFVEPLQSVERLEQLQGAEAGDWLLVAGGDEILQRVLHLSVAQQLVLGVLPAGQADSFAHSVGVPINPNQACRAIAVGHLRAIDVGTLNERPFLNIARIQLGEQVCDVNGAINAGFRCRLRNLSGLLSRVFKQPGFRAQIEGEDHVAVGRWLDITIANAEASTGGRNLFQASGANGELRLRATRHCPWWYVAWAALRKRTGGEFAHCEAVVELHGRSFCIDSPYVRQAMADGEPIGKTPVKAKIRPALLQVIVSLNTT